MNTIHCQQHYLKLIYLKIKIISDKKTPVSIFLSIIGEIDSKYSSKENPF